MTNCDKMAIELMDNDNFAGYLRKKQAARDFLENNISGLTVLNNREKVSAIHKLVTNYFRWDGKYTPNIGKSYKDLVESKTGNGTEINMFLTS